MTSSKKGIISQVPVPSTHAGCTPSSESVASGDAATPTISRAPCTIPSACAARAWGSFGPYPGRNPGRRRSCHGPATYLNPARETTPMVARQDRITRRCRAGCPPTGPGATASSLPREGPRAPWWRGARRRENGCPGGLPRAEAPRRPGRPGEGRRRSRPRAPLRPGAGSFASRPCCKRLRRGPRTRRRRPSRNGRRRRGRHRRGRRRHRRADAESASRHSRRLLLSGSRLAILGRDQPRAWPRARRSGGEGRPWPSGHRPGRGCRRHRR